jgi:hypothetical protein
MGGTIDALFSIGKSLIGIGFDAGAKLTNAVVNTTGEVVSKVADAGYEGVKAVGTGIGNDAKAIGEATKPLADKVQKDLKSAQEALGKTATNLATAAQGTQPTRPTVGPIVPPNSQASHA